jgi:hypothetical protein
MNTTQLKAHVFDAEQAIAWARQAIEDGDSVAALEALDTAGKSITQAREEAAKGE